jgi:hypothetical protein
MDQSRTAIASWASGPNGRQERILWRLYSGAKGAKRRSYTLLERKTGGVAPRGRIWLHQVRERCQSKAPNERCYVLSVDELETQLDMHLQPNHGILGGCGPAHMDTPSHSSRVQGESSHCIPLKRPCRCRAWLATT